jgi:hypothetical protein
MYSAQPMTNPETPRGRVSARVVFPIFHIPYSIFRLSAFTLLLFAAVPAHANWYQVEVIVFEYLNPDPDGEVWNADPGLPDRGRTVDPVWEAAEQDSAAADAAAQRRIAFQVLPTARHRLDGIHRLLRQSRDYRPLLHLAWQQPGTPSRAVYLEEPRIKPDPVDEPVMPASETAEPPERVIQGTVRMRVTRFLHVDVDMAYLAPLLRRQVLPVAGAPGAAEPAAGATSTTGHVRLRESRRMKLNELHYFDHPLFGIIVQVSRLQAEKESGPEL